MAYMSTAAQSANLVSGLFGMQQEAAGYEAAGEATAGAYRYQGAVNANEILINAENTARSAEARAEADNFNATLAEQMATSATEKAGADTHDYRRAMFGRLAEARAVRAASGVTLEGSPLMVDENTFAQIEFGAQRIVYGGQLESSRLRNQSTLLRSQAGREQETADLAREAGKRSAGYAVTGAELAARTSIATGASKAASSRYAGYGATAKNLTSLGTTLSTSGVKWG